MNHLPRTSYSELVNQPVIQTSKSHVMFYTALFLPSQLAKTMFIKHWRLFIDLKGGMLSSDQSFQDLEMSDSLGSVLTAKLVCGLRHSHRLHEDTVSQARLRGNSLS